MNGSETAADGPGRPVDGPRRHRDERGPLRRDPFSRALDAIHLLAGCLFLVMALGALSLGAPSSGTAVVWFAGWLAATAVVAGMFHRKHVPPGPALTWLHAAWTLVLLPQVFNGLRFLVPALPGGDPLPLPPPHLEVRRFDDLLARLDLAWFHWDVPRWSEAVLTPGLADGMMVFYAIYFLMPVILLGAFALRRDLPGIRRAAFMVSIGLYATYGLYLLVPACGPRHAYVGLSEPLPAGMWTGLLHDFIRDLEPQPYDAFPSAHVVLGTLCAVIAWPRGGWLRWFMAVAAAGTVASTVFLRYHWAVDVLAGFVLVAASMAAAWLLARRAGRRREPSAEGHGDRMDDLLAGSGPGGGPA